MFATQLARVTRSVQDLVDLAACGHTTESQEKWMALPPVPSILSKAHHVVSQIVQGAWTGYGIMVNWRAPNDREKTSGSKFSCM